MLNANVQKVIEKFTEILDQSPLDQMEDTQSILTKFAQELAVELGEIVVQSPYNEGVRMYFDEKTARFDIKQAVGL